jgi:hypothetical protein
VQFTRRGLAVLSEYLCMAYAMMAWHLQMQLDCQGSPQHGVAASSAKTGVLDAEG